MVSSRPKWRDLTALCGAAYFGVIPTEVEGCLCLDKCFFYILTETYVMFSIMSKLTLFWIPALTSALACLALLVLFAGCTGNPSSVVSETGSGNAERPNILWIVAEDMCRRIGAFGDRVAATPRLDRLASEGVMFPNTFATSGVCAPSRSTIITGVHPNTLGTQHMRTKPTIFSSPDFRIAYEAVPPPQVKAFPEVLRAVGYYTVNRTKTDYQFGEPFTIWDDSGPSAHWRNRPEGVPFFFYFTLMTTHESTVWPLDHKPVDLVQFFIVLGNLIRFADRENITDPKDVLLPSYYPDCPVVREDMARFYDNIAIMDTEVGRLLDQLEEDGLNENTLVVFTADNGDGLPRAKRWVYDSGIRVPLIVRWPGRLKPGTVREELVSFADLAPTMLSLAGVTVPDHMQGRVFLGPYAVSPPQYVYAARDRMDNVVDTVRAVRDLRFKYIRNFLPETPYVQPLPFRDAIPMMQEMLRLHAEGLLSGPETIWFSDTRPVEELYDTLPDPDEVHNLAGEPAFHGELLRLRAEMDHWLEASGDIGTRMTEEEMVAGMWPGDVQPLTEKPWFTTEPEGEGTTRVRISSFTEGASIGYSLREPGAGAFSSWLLYSRPLSVANGTTIRAKAIRYGYKASRVVFLHIPDHSF